MYRLREMDVDDKVCEQVSMTLLTGISPKEVIERCAQQSQPWSTKKRRVRGSTVVALVLFVIGMALWSRLNQCQVWQKLVGKLSGLHPAEPESRLGASELSGRRKELLSACLQALMRERCQLIAHPQTMKSALDGRYRLMAVDGTVFNTADTEANGQANAAQQQSLWGRCLPAGAVCAVGRVWEPCGGGTDDEPLRCLLASMELISCSLKLAQTCWCWWTLASPPQAFLSTCEHKEGIHSEPCKQAPGNTCLSNDGWPMARGSPG